MWLSAALLLTMVFIHSLPTLLVFILGHYGPPCTGRIQQTTNKVPLNCWN